LRCRSASLLRQRFPWVYVTGMQYNNIVSGLYSRLRLIWIKRDRQKRSDYAIIRIRRFWYSM
jgi:hypothetical protein